MATQQMSGDAHPSASKTDLSSSTSSNPSKFARFRSSTLSKVLGKGNSSKTSLPDSESAPSSTGRSRRASLASLDVSSAEAISPTPSNISTFSNLDGDLDAPSNLAPPITPGRRDSNASSTNGSPNLSSFRRSSFGLSRPPAAPSSGSNSRNNVPRASASGSWHRPAENFSVEQTAQRMRTLPRLASYSSSKAVPTLKTASPAPSRTSSSLQVTSSPPDYQAGSALQANPIPLPPLSIPETEADVDGIISAAEGENTEDDDEEPAFEDEDDDEHSSPSDSHSGNGPPISIAPRMPAPTPGQFPRKIATSKAAWTTFQSFTPGLLTARPTGDSPSGSYFDFSHSESSQDNTAAATPTGTSPASSRPPFTPRRSQSFGQMSPIMSPRLEAGDMLEREDAQRKQQAFQGALDTASPLKPLNPPPSAPRRLSIQQPTTLAPLDEDSITSAFGPVSSARRASMYEFRDLPPYASIPRSHANSSEAMVAPREDEGAEDLPDYTCAVHIEGWMPRKLEFTAPGIQASNRTWKRRYVILHGTSIRILRDAPEEALLKEVAPAARRVAAPTNGNPVRANSLPNTNSFFVAPDVQPGKLREAEEEATGPNSVALSATEVTGKDRGTREMHVHTGHYDGAQSSLSSSIISAKKVLRNTSNLTIRNYSLQSAESGLAADYIKKKHVIRIRAEGEQFLLQAADDRGVIDWIEALQAATNIALDLDDRPLPKFITLPRRRRRRPPGVTDATPSQTDAATAAQAGEAPAGGQAGRDIVEEQRSAQAQPATML